MPMKRIQWIILVMLVVVIAGGCAVRVRGGARIAIPDPDLIQIQTGLYVVADYHEPVFYSDGVYWTQRGGYWHRSSLHTGGWVRVRSAPVLVARIHRPHTYVHYRAGVRVKAKHHVRQERRDHRAKVKARKHHRDHR
jgi:hypothetical protein